MDPNSINQVIDKVAEKVGVAAAEFQPLGEQIVREYALARWMEASMFVVVAVLVFATGCTLAVWLRRIANASDPRIREDRLLVSGTPFLFGSLGAIGMLAAGFYCASQALSPTYNVCKELLGR